MQDGQEWGTAGIGIQPSWRPLVTVMGVDVEDWLGGGQVQ